jgi:hypothetical protein
MTVSTATACQPQRSVFSRDFWFGALDSRPIGIFRICFAALLLKDALYHLPLAGVFYSDNGVLPRLVLWDGLASSEHLSLMDALAYDWMAALFFLLWAGVALCLLVGYRTRLMAVLNFVIVLSVHERNIYLLTGADTVLRVLSFWMMFLPLAESYSIDSIRAPTTHGQQVECHGYAFPLRMIQFQVALIYLVTGLLKLMGDSWRSGTALYTVLQVQSILLPFGQWLGTHAPDWLLRALTYGVMLIELAFPFLVFAPFARSRLRAIALAAGTALHIGIALTMVMPMTDFSLLMLTSYLLFFEPTWIDWLEKGLRRLTASPLRRAVGQKIVQRSWHIVQQNLLPMAVSSLAPAEHRFRAWQRVAVTAALSGCMIVVIWWNLIVIGEYAAQPLVPPLPAVPNAVLWYGGLWQYWDMFAPLPLQVDGRITIPGTFEDGTSQQLYGGLPGAAVHWGPSMRWQKFEENVNHDRDDRLLGAWAGYYCWLYNVQDNRPPGSRLATLEIHFVYRQIPARSEPAQQPQDDLLWSHWCLDEYEPDR